MSDRLSRRAVLALTAGAAASVAGCTGGSGGDETETVDSLPPPVAGDPQASNTVMVFEDFACPHCRQFALEVFPKLESAYLEPGRVRYEHHDFPIPVDDRWSWQAASAARAVQDTVDDAAFFAYAKRLYERQDRYSMDVIGTQAEAVGADPEPVRRAARQETYRPVLEADRELGTQLDLQGTPQVYVNGTRLDSYGYETVAAAIENQL